MNTNGSTVPTLLNTIRTKLTQELCVKKFESEVEKSFWMKDE